MALTIHDAEIILGMIARGDNQHDIAAWFGENQARIVEVQKGDYGTLKAALKDLLPPKGAPGIKGRRLLAFVEKAVAALDEGNIQEARELLKNGLKRFMQSG